MAISNIELIAPVASHDVLIWTHRSTTSKSGAKGGAKSGKHGPDEDAQESDESEGDSSDEGETSEEGEPGGTSVAKRTASVMSERGGSTSGYHGGDLDDVRRRRSSTGARLGMHAYSISCTSAGYYTCWVCGVLLCGLWCGVP